MNYCAIIGDIVGSKKFKNRQEVQDRFNEVLYQTNQLFDHHIASNFVLTLGDEFQGLLHTPSSCLEIIDYVSEQLSPIDIVFGIGIGPMETKFSKYSSVGSDGPAYWYARKMVEKAKQKLPSICFYSNAPEDELINSLLLFRQSCIRSQTKKQKQIVKLYKELGSQYRVAEKLSITQSAVSGTLKKAFNKEVQKSKESIEHFLKMKWDLKDNNF